MKNISKIINSIVNRIGNDKMMHLLVGAMFTYLIVLVMVMIFEYTEFSEFILSFFIAWSAVMLISVIKEHDDSIFDKKDILYAMLGWFIACVTIIPFIFFV